MRMRGLSPRASLSRQAPVIQSRESRNLRDRRVRDILIFPVLRENEGAAGFWKRDGAVLRDTVNYIWALPASSIGCLEPTHIAPITARPPRLAPRINVIRCDG